jgi:folate-binding protein YgfZ
MPIALRADRAVFRFSGPDAQKLLNDVVTGVVKAEPGPARWWALLSAQGKIQAEGLVGFAEDALWLDVHESVADDFFKRMRMYKLRAQVTIDDLRASHRVGWSATPVSDGIAHEDVRAANLGYRVIAPVEAASGWSNDPSGYVAARVAEAIAEQGADFAADTAFAHDIGMDILEGIDFSKGCYVGQEVVSRMKHRGTARRRPVLVIGNGLVPGAPLLVDGRESGTIGSVAGERAVGIVRLDRVTDPMAVTAGEAPVTLALPTWASYAFGESAPNE